MATLQRRTFILLLWLTVVCATASALCDLWSDTRTSLENYDALYRLTGETVAGGGDPGSLGSIGYTLDKVGNRLNRVTSGADLQLKLPSSTSSYNARDWLASDTYDGNGNTQNSGLLATRYPLLATQSVPDVYDFENHLILRTRPDGTQVNISYDADGNRIQKTVLDAGYSLLATHYYLVDTNNPTGYSQVLEERTTSFGGSTSVSSVEAYTYGRTDLRSVFDSSTATSYQLLLLRWPRLRSRTDRRDRCRHRRVHLRRLRSPYRLDFHFNFNFNSYLYCGEQFDFDLGLYFNRARYLNPDTGRFWSMDTYEGAPSDPASLHKYLYANANPLSGKDPSGNFSMGEMMQAVQSAGILVRIAIPAITRIGFTVAQRLAAAALRPLFVFAGGLPIATQMGQRLSVFDRFLRFFVTPTQGYAPVASWLKDMFQMMGIRLQQGHVFIQQAWYRAGSPNQWYPGDAAANLGMQRLGNAGFNLLAMPDGLNRALGANNLQGSIGTTAYAGGVVTGTASSIARAARSSLGAHHRSRG